MTVMIVSGALISGFKNEISGKVFGFLGHIHIMDFEAVSSNASESVPISKEQDFVAAIDTAKSFQYPRDRSFLGISLGGDPVAAQTNGGIRHIQSYILKTGVIQTKEEIEGIVVKGVDTDYDWDYLEQFILEGSRLPLKDSLGRDIMVSEQTAKRLKLSLGDKMRIYFVSGEDQTPRMFKICGIYKTGLEEYDSQFALADIRVLRKLYGWEDDQVSGFEVFVEDMDDLEAIGDAVFDMMPMDLYSATVKDLQPNIFGWLELQNKNEVVILALMLVVGILNMITALIILIMERTNMIGVLKSLGGSDGMIQRIFLYYGAYICLLGLFLGNLIGIGLCLLQKHFEFITLSEEDYYVSVAPIDLDFSTILFLNLGTLVVTVLVLIIPSFLVRFISPVKAVRFK